MCVIPQEPVLFSGKLRDNIDPFHQFTDEEIVETMNLLNFGMTTRFFDEEVKENASNFSVGQKQMICIGRAILRKCRVIVLDEATAAIDLKTDEIIQNAIKDKFQDCTVLTIAHRINTIKNSDRILILDNGKIINFDSPSALSSNISSLL